MNPSSGATGGEHDVLSGDVVYESDTEVLNNAASFSCSQQMHFPGAGEAIGDVNGFGQEICNLCDNPWAPFPSRPGFRLASSFLESKVLKSRINEYFPSGLGNSESVGYASAKKTRFCIHTHLNAPCSVVCIWSASCASHECSFKLQKQNGHVNVVR